MKIEHVGAARTSICASNEGCRGISDILKIRSPAKAYVKWQTENGSFHCLCRITGQPRITIDTVNGQRSQADAIDTMIEKVDSRISFIRALENSVMRAWFTDRRFVKRNVGIAHPEHRRRAGVNYPLNGEGLPGLENIKSSDYVHEGARHRIGFTCRNLQ